MFTLQELQDIISDLKTALKRAAVNGGVTDYTIKSSQSETRVKQASMAEITEQIDHYTRLYNEQLEIEDGSAISYMTGFGLGQGVA